MYQATKIIEENIRDFFAFLNEKDYQCCSENQMLDLWCNEYFVQEKLSTLELKQLLNQKLIFFRDLYMTSLKELNITLDQLENDTLNLSLDKSSFSKIITIADKKINSEKDKNIFFVKLISDERSRAYLNFFLETFINASNNYLRRKKSQQENGLEEIGRIIIKGVSITANHISNHVGNNTNTQSVRSKQYEYGISKSDFKEIFNYTYNNIRDGKIEIRSSNLDNKSLLFFLIGAGFASVITTVIVNQKSSNKIEKIADSPPKFQPSLEPFIETKNILLLILNAEDNELILELKNLSQKQNTISESLTKRLYKSTLFLWMGNEDNYQNSQLEKYFNPCYHQKNYTQYDIYCIKIELNESHPGFQEKNVNRLAAFKKLPEIGKILTVSERLSETVYQASETYLYRI